MIYRNFFFTFLSVAFLATMSSPLTAQPGGQADFGDIWKVTYSSLDASASAAFCKDVLNMEEIPVTDPDLAAEHKWLKYGENGTEVHFVTASSQKQRNYLTTFIADIDYDMSSFTDWMNSHVGIWVDDLSPIIETLQDKGVAFLGPVRRADGIYQLYLRVPGAGYLEFDTGTMPDEDYLYLVKDWAEVWRDQADKARSELLYKTNLYGGKDGFAFDSSEDWTLEDKIKTVRVNWGDYLHAITVEYNNNFSVTVGAELGENNGTLELEEDEHITTGTVCIKRLAALSSAKLVSSVQFNTNKGRRLLFGDTSNDCFWLIWNKGNHEVVGLYGTASSDIHSLGFTFRSLDKTD